MNGIGGHGAGGDLMKAALRQMQANQERLGAKPSGAEDAASPKFSEVAKKALGEVEDQVEATNTLEKGVIEGRLDIHEVAAQLKETEITFQFALQVRNKLLDAYREVMRMSV